MNSETQTCDLRADFKRDEEQEEERSAVHKLGGWRCWEGRS